MMNETKKSIQESKKEFKEESENEIKEGEIIFGELPEIKPTNEKRKTLGGQIDLNVNYYDDFVEEDMNKVRKIQRNIKIAKFFISDFVKMLLVFLFLIVFFIN
jgi:hypothetical protein